MKRRSALLCGILMLSSGLIRTAVAQSWVTLRPVGDPPPGRMNNTAVYDPGSDRMIVFGGFTTDTACCAGNDVWILSHANRKAGARRWSNMLPNSPSSDAPPATAAASAVYDETTNQMIVYGGQANGVSSTQVWILHNANGFGGSPWWSHATPAGSPPPPRQNHQAAYDPVSDRMIVVGGLENISGPPVSLLNDVWVLTGATQASPEWKQLPVSGEPPSPRHGFAAAYDSASDRLLIYGGCTDASFGCGDASHELWALSAASGRSGTPEWTRIASFDDPNCRPAASAQFATAAFDVAADRLFVFGGRVGSDGVFGTFTNDTWVLTNTESASPRWARITVGGALPAPRGQSVSPDLYDPVTSRLMVFGGPGLNDTLTLDTRRDVAPRCSGQ